MKDLKIVLMLTVLSVHVFAQQNEDNKTQINTVITEYTECVIKRDSVVFYNLFNGNNVTWCAAIMDKSQSKEVATNGIKEAGSNYFSGSYKGFMRSLFMYKSTEDKFDNIQIIEDGTVASVTMDYSFWADNKMTNWGSKFLGLIKKDGQWKITSVIYSLELTQYFEQPPLNDRMKRK